MDDCSVLRHNSKLSLLAASRDRVVPHLSGDAAAAAADAEEGRKAARKQRTPGDAIQRMCNEARRRGTCFHSTAPGVRAPATEVLHIGLQKAPTGLAVCAPRTSDEWN